MSNKSEHTLFIKNMVCPRCIKVVTEELTSLGIKIVSVELGEVITKQEKDKLPLDEISKVLEENGFQLIEDSKAKNIEQIKTEIISVIQQYKDIDLETINFSNYLSKKLNKDYPSISSLFSRTEGITIEHFIILQKIEKAKELLKYGELTLSEIAFQLGYSSVQHLSRQFKNVSGLTASQYKDNLTNLRITIDSIGKN